MTFMKLAYFDIADASQVAFIDADVVAINDWSALLSPLPVGDAIAGCTEDNMRDFEVHWNPELDPGWYLNCGILQVKPEVWQDLYAPTWKRLLGEYKERGFTLLEQDLLNATVRGQARRLPQGLNCRPAYGHSLQGAAIIHYAGWWKPWLSVQAEESQLPTRLIESLHEFEKAERILEEHLMLNGRYELLAKLKRQRSLLRGHWGWRAHKRFLRSRLVAATRRAYASVSRVGPQDSQKGD